MSEPHKDQSASAAGNGDDGRKKHKSGRVKRAKKLALFRFRKLKNQLQRKKRRLLISCSSSSSNFGCLFGKRSGGDGGGGGCCLSFSLKKKSPNSGSDTNSPVESQTSDPNNPAFTFDLLKDLIEKNDFYSKECNTHFDGIDSD